MAVEVTKSEVSAPTPRLFTVDDYYQMAKVGILGPTDRVQLIDGVIYDMPPIGPDHADGVGGITELFFDRFRPLARIRVRQPVRLGSRSESEPDIVLARLWPGVQ